MTGPRLDDAELRRQWAAYQASKKAAPAPVVDPYKPTTPRAASESTSAASGKPTGEVYWNDPVGLARQAAQGASFGLADEAEAAVRAPFSAQPYDAIRDDIRGQNKAYSDANPGTAMLANVGGGLLTGGAVKAGGKALLSRLAPKMAAKLSSAALPGTSLLTTKGRALNAAAEGALMGGAAGAGSAEGGLKERVQGAAVGAAMGGALAGGFSAIADGTRGLAKLSRAAIAGPEARALPSVQEGAQTRLLSNLARNNKSVDDLAAWSATADAPDILGEGLGTPGLRQLGTAYRYGNTPDAIEQGLTRRARDEVGRVQGAVRAELGDPIDDEAFKAAKHAEALAASGDLYAQSNALPDVTSDEVGRVADTLKKMPQYGQRVLKRAETLAAAREDAFPKSFRTPETPDTPSRILGPDGTPASVVKGTPSQTTPVAVRNVFDLRRGLDEVVGEMQQSGESPALIAELSDMRARLDAVAKGAGKDAGDVVRLADEAYKKPMQERDAFAMGQAKGRAMQPADQERLLSDPNAEYVAKGVGNTIQEDLGRLQSGAAGQIRNPAPTVMGSDYADARLNVAARGDKGKVERIQSTASNAQRRLQNRYDVLKGSQTAERMASDAMELGTDVQKVAQAARSPLTAALNLLGKATEGARRRATGAELDLAAELLMAGAPGAMTRQKAIETLREAAPALVAKQAGRVATRGRIAGAVTGSAMR